MPKLRPTQAEVSARTINAVIESHLILQGISKDKLAKLLGMSLTCLYKRINEPDGWKRGELRRLCRMLKIPEADQVKLLMS